MQGHDRKLFEKAQPLNRAISSISEPHSDEKKTKHQDVLGALYFRLVKDPDMRSATERLFFDEHFARAVEEAFKCLNNYVKTRSGLKSADGADLMRSVFSPKNPVLRVNRMKSQSQISEQQGYMDIFAGCMTGIRNPRAHEHRITDEQEEALELISIADHLIRKARKTIKARKR